MGLQSFNCFVLSVYINYIECNGNFYAVVSEFSISFNPDVFQFHVTHSHSNVSTGLIVLWYTCLEMLKVLCIIGKIVQKFP